MATETRSTAELAQALEERSNKLSRGAEADCCCTNCLTGVLLREAATRLRQLEAYSMAMRSAVTFCQQHHGPDTEP